MSVSGALPNSIMSTCNLTSSVSSSCGSSTVSTIKSGTSSTTVAASSSALVKKLGCETVQTSGGGGLLLCETPLGVADIGCLDQTTTMGTCDDSINQSRQNLQAFEQLSQLQAQNGLSEDARTLQLALELSLVGLNDEQVCYFERQNQQQQQHHHMQHQHHQTNLQKTDYDLDTLQAISAAIAANQNPHGHGAINSNMFSSDTQTVSAVSGLLMPSTILEDRSKKSQNMTECVPVPSSEHVAEIVGRQGCKIKALRAKTNTYIKTPVRGEEPVFVVTGRKEDVNKAKREILSAADHFSLIRATRKPSMEGSNSSNHSSNGGGSLVGSNGTGVRSVAGPPSLPGQVTIQVRVPYRVVGLVVGPKGATIKHIQQETQTYIVTPSREKEPIFEVTGMPDQVQTARKQIEAHIALRTGNTQSNNSNAVSSGVSAGIAVNEILPNELHTINTLSQMLNEDINPDFLVSLYKNGICSGLDYGDTDSLGVDGIGIAGTICTGLNTTTSASSLIFSNATTTAAAAYTTNMNSSSNMLNTTTRFQMQQQHQQQPQPPTTLNSIIGECSNGETAAATAMHNLVQETQQMQINEKAIFHQNDVKSLNLVNAVANTAINGANVANAPYSIIANHATTNSIIVNGLTRSCSSASSTTSTKSTNNSAGGSSSNSPPELLNIWKNLSDSIDVDEGIGDSPNIWNLPAAANLSTLNGTHCSPTASISPTDSLLGDISNSQRIGATQHANNVLLQQCDFNAATTNNIAVGAGAATTQRRECYVCAEKEVSNLALVPCGHNMFCMDCANHICLSIDAVCPVCSSIVYHAMRILA